MLHVNTDNYRHKLIVNSFSDYLPDDALNRLLSMLPNDLSIIDADNGRLVQMQLNVNHNPGFYTAKYILIYITKNF